MLRYGLNRRTGDDAPQRKCHSVKALIGNPPLLLFVEVIGLAAGLAMVIATTSGRAARCPSSSRLMAIRGAGLLALSPNTTMKLFEVLQYERRFYFYMAGTLVLGLYLTIAGFSA